MLKKYPRLRHITRIGFMIEFTLYGQMYGSPIVRMSVCPSTGTMC